jgi:predicted phage terminase large subunit-like protein
MQTVRVAYGEDPTGLGFYWPQSAQKRAEMNAIKRGDPSAYESVYQCRPGSREGQVFLESDFVEYIPPVGLENGVLDESIRRFVSRGTVVQAWDTASSVAAQSAYSVCVTALLMPCNKYHRAEDPAVYGPCDDHYDVHLLDLHRGRYAIGDLVGAFKMQYHIWRPELILVEKKSSGITLVQTMPALGMPVKGIEPEGGKRERATSNVGAGSAQGWFRQHRVLHPKDADWVAPWKRELKDFTGSDEGISDQVDASVHLIRHAIMSGAHTALLPTDWSPERGTMADSQMAMGEGGVYAPFADPRLELLNALDMLGSMSNDAFEGLCGRCISYSGDTCTLHRMKKIALDSCLMFSDANPVSYYG